MRRILISLVCAAICLSMVTAPALASDPQCKQVFVRFEGSTYLEAPDCDFGGTSYPFCLVSRMTGTLNGTYYFYFTAANYVEVLDPVPGHAGFWAGYGLSRYATNQGEIWSRDSWIADIARTVDFSAFSQVSYVDGGTGAYAGATGDIFQFGSDLEGSTGRGEVCTPK